MFKSLFVHVQKKYPPLQESSDARSVQGPKEQDCTAELFPHPLSTRGNPADTKGEKCVRSGGM